MAKPDNNSPKIIQLDYQVKFTIVNKMLYHDLNPEAIKSFEKHIDCPWTVFSNGRLAIANIKGCPQIIECRIDLEDIRTRKSFNLLAGYPKRDILPKEASSFFLSFTYYNDEDEEEQEQEEKTDALLYADGKFYISGLLTSFTRQDSAVADLMDEVSAMIDAD